MRLRTIVAAAALVLLAACSSGPAPSNKPTFGGGKAPTVAAGDLARAKQQAGIEECPAADGKPPAENALPDLTLECLGGGRPVRLSGLTGAPTVINLWASWCKPCQEEFPLLAKADTDYDGRVRFIGIDYKDEAPDQAIELARSSGGTYPQLVDPNAKTVRSLKVVGLPQTVFVDAQGRMVATERVAFRSYADLTAAIDKHLGVSR